VIDRADDYSWAVVSEPGHRYLWVLSRQPALDPATYDQVVADLNVIGFDPDRLIRTPQENAP